MVYFYGSEKAFKEITLKIFIEHTILEMNHMTKPSVRLTTQRGCTDVKFCATEPGLGTPTIHFKPSTCIASSAPVLILHSEVIRLWTDYERGRGVANQIVTHTRDGK